MSFEDNSVVQVMLKTNLLVFRGFGIALLAITGSWSNAQIVRDGSVGPDSTVQPLLDANNSYLVDETMGVRLGDSLDILLHSFSEFSLAETEQVQFTGTDSIETIISRVTGDSVSLIDGTLRSDIPGAHFFLLNPRGIIFGENATLNVGGHFSASTSDSLMFADGESLQVYSTDAPPILRSSLPADFGFLSDTAASIELNGSQLLSASEVSLHGNTVAMSNGVLVRSLASVSLVANNIDIDGSSRIEVFSGIDRDVSGSITLEALNDVVISGSGGNSSLFTIGQEGSTGGEIRIKADQILLQDGVQILTRNNGNGTSNDIILNAVTGIFMSGFNAAGKGVTLFSNTNNEQNAGDIRLSARAIEMNDGADLLSQNPGGGDSGNITLNADDTLILAGNDTLGESTDQSNIQTVSSSSGRAGVIEISTGTLSLDNGARIQNGGQSSGDGNTITITASENINLSGNNSQSLFGSSISSTAIGFGLAGSAGDIVLSASQINLNDGARVSSGAVGAGNGGNITIIATDSLNLSGVQGNTAPEDAIEGDNNGSRIEVQAFDGSSGDAGALTINAGDINLRDQAIILSNAYQGQGGDMAITANQIVSIQSDITSSVRNAQGDGGDVVIDADLLVLGNSNIKAQAVAGNGGTINIEGVDQFVALAGSELDASSQTGNDGLIISPPELRREFGNDVIDTEFLDISSLLRSSCSNYNDNSQFSVSSSQATSFSADGLLPSLVSVVSYSHQEADNNQAQLSTLRGRAYDEQRRGDYKAAANTFADAIEIAKRSKGEIDLSESLGELGNALIIAGKSGAAESLLNQALQKAQTNGDFRLSARLYNNLGNYYVVQSQFDEAVGAYQLAISNSRKTNNPLQLATALANLARLNLQQGDLEQANELLVRADTSLQSVPLSSERASLNLHLAKTHHNIAAMDLSFKRNSLLKAHDYLIKVNNFAEQNNDLQLLSYSQGSLASLYQLEQRYFDALVLTRVAIALSEQIQNAESIYRWHWQEGQLLHAMGDSNNALHSYRRALDEIDQSRQATLSRYASSSTYFDQLVAPVYLEMVNTLLDVETNTHDKVASQSFLLEARATIERYKSAELRNYFRDECVLKRAAEQTELDDVSKNTAIVYPIVLNDRIELLLSAPTKEALQTKRSIRRFSIAVDSAELEQRVHSLRYQVDHLSRSGAFLAESQWVYDRLVRPFIGSLSGSNVDTLIFVPSGVLSLIPMSALHDRSEYLIQKYALGITLGLSLTRPRSLPKAGNKVLMGGISEAIGEFPALDAVPGELFAVKSVFGGDVLLNNQFTVENFEGHVRNTDYSIIHIASHAQFTGDASGNYLQAYDKPIYFDDLHNVLSTTKYRDRPLELLVLSACQTASGNQRAALGLAGISVRAGARSVLASLWSIDDESAAALIEEFYTIIGTQNVSKAEALRQAQIRLLEQEQFAHPFYWSAFILIDNWL